MKNATWATVVILLTGFSAAGRGQTCANYTFNQKPQYDDKSDPTGHTSGDHLFAGTATGSCTYSSSGGQYCEVANLAVAAVEPTDSGQLTTSPIGYHVSQASTNDGSQTTPNASSGNSATSVAVVAWEWCLISGCYFTVTSNPVSVPAGAVWSHTQTAGFACPAEPDPTHLMSIAVTPPSAVIYNVAGGDGGVTTQQFTATGTYANGATKPISAVWTSSNTSIATVNGTGLAKATGTAWGTLTITASSGSVSGNATLTVSYNTDQGGGGGGGGDGDECGSSDDCGGNLCCYNYMCSVCQGQGLVQPKPSGEHTGGPLIKEFLWQR